jgi:hypothetical protein
LVTTTSSPGFRSSPFAMKFIPKVAFWVSAMSRPVQFTVVASLSRVGISG